MGLALLLRQRRRSLAESASRERGARVALEQYVMKLHQAEADLHAALHAREEFLSSASHELRTPLTSLSLLYRHLLRSASRDGKVQLSQEQTERFLRTSDRQFERLDQLVDNLIDVSKRSIGHGSIGHVVLNLEELDLAEVVRQVAQRVREQFVAAGSKLELDLPEKVVGHWDRFRVEQVVTNILINAARYGLGNPVRVRLRRTPSVARLSVEDSGVGIPEEDLGHVFDCFTRVGPARASSGLGVGLYISHAIVEAHGGTLRVESEVGRGSTFTVELPLPFAAEDGAPRGGPAA
jgi:signal transduction histidine kinase